MNAISLAKPLGYDHLVLVEGGLLKIKEAGI